MKLKCSICGRETSGEYNQEGLERMATASGQFLEEMLEGIVCGRAECREKHALKFAKENPDMWENAGHPTAGGVN
jgi:hypothetical protein